MTTMHPPAAANVLAVHVLQNEQNKLCVLVSLVTMATGDFQLTLTGTCVVNLKSSVLFS